MVNHSSNGDEDSQNILYPKIDIGMGVQKELDLTFI